MRYRWIRQPTTPSFGAKQFWCRLLGIRASHKIGEQFKRHTFIITVPICVRGNRIPTHLARGFIKRSLDNYERELREGFRLWNPLIALFLIFLLNNRPSSSSGTFLVAFTTAFLGFLIDSLVQLLASFRQATRWHPLSPHTLDKCHSNPS